MGIRVTTKHIEDGIVGRDRLHEFSALGSDLRIGPGEWPTEIETDLGNGRPFIRVSTKHTDWGDRDLYLVRYEQANGCVTLNIFND